MTVSGEYTEDVRWELGEQTKWRSWVEECKMVELKKKHKKTLTKVTGQSGYNTMNKIT